MKMSLEDLYEIHDDFETLLRKLTRMKVVEARLMEKVWAAHDELERMTIEAQSMLQEDALFHE